MKPVSSLDRIHDFGGLGAKIVKPATSKPITGLIQVSPGIFQGPDGKLHTAFAANEAANPAQKMHPAVKRVIDRQQQEATPVQVQAEEKPSLEGWIAWNPNTDVVPPGKIWIQLRNGEIRKTNDVGTWRWDNPSVRVDSQVVAWRPYVDELEVGARVRVKKVINSALPKKLDMRGGIFFVEICESALISLNHLWFNKADVELIRQ